MRNYIVRNIGWPYNDSTYQYDGAYQMVAKFLKREDADEFVALLNREYLIYNFRYIDRYETFTPEKFVTRKSSACEYLVGELKVNPTIQLDVNKYSDYSVGMFLTKPTPQQLDILVAKFGISFFEVVEIEEGTNSFIRLIESLDYIHYRDPEPFWDYDGHRELYFTSRSEAVAHFIKRNSWRFESRSKYPVLKNTYENLSDFPEMLKDFVEEDEHLSYEDGGIVLLEGIGHESLLRLNSLLKIPFFKFEDAPEFFDQVYKEKNIDTVLDANSKAWDELEKRNLKYGLVEKIQASAEYLDLFIDDLRVYGADSYADIIRRNFLKYFGKNLWVDDTYYSLTDGISSFTLFVLIRKAEQINGKQHVEVSFGLETTTVSDLPAGVGEGDTLRAAVEMSLDDWFMKNQKAIRELGVERN